jgi:hypothetical protein
MPGQKREARLSLDVPGIHVLQRWWGRKDVDGRDKPGHDEFWNSLRFKFPYTPLRSAIPTAHSANA